MQLDSELRVGGSDRQRSFLLFFEFDFGCCLRQEKRHQAKGVWLGVDELTGA